LEKSWMNKVCFPLFFAAAFVGCGGSGMNSLGPTTNPAPAPPAANPVKQGVTVTAPAQNSTVPPLVTFTASAQTTCPKGVASMGVYTAPGVLAYTSNGPSLNGQVPMNPGTYDAVVQAWDRCGGAAKTPVHLTVKLSSALASPNAASYPGTTLTDLQKGSGWTAYALLPPVYGICSSCKASGPGTTWSLTQGVNSPSLSGSAAKFTIGGTAKYTDVLWNNHLVGDFSAHGMPDSDHSIAAGAHNFVYDVYFFATNLPASQALEFDINLFVNGKSYIWGHECRIAGGYEWDIWDNQGAKWHPTGVPCHPNNNAWNQVTLKAQRTSDGHLLFQSITLNGNTATLNHYDSPTSTNWNGITINYQMDGNSSQQGYSVYLDKLNFSYW
jgi:hypothetical protein